MPTLRHQVWIWRRIQKPGLGYVIVLENSTQYRCPDPQALLSIQDIGPVSQLTAAFSGGHSVELHHTLSGTDPERTRLMCRKLHHMNMSENQTSSTEGIVIPGKWIGQLVAAVLLAEGIWGFLVSLTNNLLVPLLSREMGADPQSPLYLGKADFNFPDLFKSVLALCIAGIVFVLLHEWSRKKRLPARVKTVRVTRKVSRPAFGGSSTLAAPDAVSEPEKTSLSMLAMPAISQVPLQQPESAPPSSVAPSKQTKPRIPKPVYYNIVGEPVNPTEND